MKAAASDARNPAVRVCLVEAGGSGRSLLIDTPALVAVTVPRKLHNWAFETEPQSGLAGRRGYQPRGKALGGSSAINAMVYMRGHPRDYDEWDCPGWAWRDVLPVFLRGEHNERGADDLHATGGPLNVADARSPNVASLAFVEAGVQAGHAQETTAPGAKARLRCVSMRCSIKVMNFNSMEKGVRPRPGVAHAIRRCDRNLNHTPAADFLPPH